MRNFTDKMLKIGAILIAIGSNVVIYWFNPELLRVNDLVDVGRYYAAYAPIILIGSVVMGIGLGIFERLLDELAI